MKEITLLDVLRSMQHSEVKNYIVPDVSSFLLGSDDGESGRFRIFDSSRDQDMLVTPHNHRFDLSCYVVTGKVENTMFVPVNDGGDLYARTAMKYNDEIGAYERGTVLDGVYRKHTKTYTDGAWYSMEAHEIHNIRFTRDTILLIIEGKPKGDTNYVLEPVTATGKMIHTLKNEDWMFQK